MGKLLGVVMPVLLIWAALAQIMPDHFQVRSEKFAKLRPFIFGDKSIWVAVMIVGCLLGWYIWNLENRLARFMVSQPSNQSAAVSDDRPTHVEWSLPNNSGCQVSIDASTMPEDTRKKFDMAVVCGFTDAAVDMNKDTRISISSLFSWQSPVTIYAPFSTLMSDAILEDHDKLASHIQCPSGVSLIPVVNHIWMKLILLPKGFNTSNIRNFSDVEPNGGKVVASFGKEMEQVVPCKTPSKQSK